MKFKPFFLRPSTRKFFQEGGEASDYHWYDYIHGYVYGRWPYLYIGTGTGESKLAKLGRPFLRLWNRVFSKNGVVPQPSDNQTAYLKRETPGFADGYHGKVMPLETIKQLVMVREPIQLPVPETILPYARAKEIVLKDPDHIVVLDCPCRSARENPCLPLDVCLIVGEPFASFVSDHHPDRTRWITSEEAVQILHEEDERGHVHHAFFKEAMLGRFYAICNCCECCCGAIQAHKNGTPMLAASGYLAQIDDDRCAGCGTCNEFCQFGALSLIDGASHVNDRLCMGCGICENKCPNGAIELVLAGNGVRPLDLPSLMEEALN